MWVLVFKYFFFPPKPHAISVKQCKKSLPSGFHGVWGRVSWSESPQVEPLWARHVKYTCVEQPAMCRAFVSLQRAILGKEGKWLPQRTEVWVCLMPHRLSKVRERECLSSQVGGERFCKSLKMGTQQVYTHKERVGLSPATAGLGPALIEGASETLLLSPRSWLTQNWNTTCGECRLQVPEAAHFPR